MTDLSKANFATLNQERLLKASLLYGDEAVVFWRAWHAENDLEEDLEPGSFRLLPLLYTNLQRQGFNDDAMPKLKGIYRQAWSKNQTLFHAMADVIRRLEDAGIRTMLLKGAAMSLLYYKNNGARPMADIDVLVPWGQARKAVALLSRQGWQMPVPFAEADLRYGHAVQFMHEKQGEFDLHWRPLHGFRTECEQEFWDKSLPVQMAGVATSAPDPTDMLFHTIVHGVPWNPVPSIRWIADALTLINAPEYTIDWSRLVGAAKAHRYGLRLKTGMGYLVETFRASVPPEVMQMVSSLPVTYLETMENRFWMGNLERRNRGPYIALCANLCQFRRVSPGMGLPGLAGFPHFLRWRLEAKSYPELMWNGIRLTMEMLFSRPFTVKPR